MKLVDFAISRPGLRMAVVAGAALVQFGPSTSLAAPVEYTFTTAADRAPTATRRPRSIAQSQPWAQVPWFPGRSSTTQGHP